MNNPRAYRAYLFLQGASAFCLATIFTLAAVYRLQTVGLDPLQLVLVGTMLEASYFLFEVPTGVVADTFSRRLSVIIGTMMVGAAEVFEGLVPAFWAILAAQVVSGIGYTFLSGATQAWIADEVGEEHLGRVFMRGSQAAQAGGLLGIAASVGLAGLSLNLPLVVGGLMLVGVGVVLIFIMPETGFKPTPREERTTWQAMGHTFSEGMKAVRRQPRLTTFLLIGLFFGLTSEGWDRLWEAHFLLNFRFPDFGGLTPVVWLGIINMGGALLGIVATEIARRRINTERRETVYRAVWVFTALRIASVLAFAWAGNFVVALAARWGKTVFAAVDDPIYDAWVAQSIDSRVRATVLSMTGQVDAIGQIAGGPLVGAIGKSVSVRAALAVSGLLLTPVLLLYGRAHRQGDVEPVVADGQAASDV